MRQTLTENVVDHLEIVRDRKRKMPNGVEVVISKIVLNRTPTDTRNQMQTNYELLEFQQSDAKAELRSTVVPNWTNVFNSPTGLEIRQRVAKSLLQKGRMNHGGPPTPLHELINSVLDYPEYNASQVYHKSTDTEPQTAMANAMEVAQKSPSEKAKEKRESIISARTEPVVKVETPDTSDLNDDPMTIRQHVKLYAMTHESFSYAEIAEYIMQQGLNPKNASGALSTFKAEGRLTNEDGIWTVATDPNTWPDQQTRVSKSGGPKWVTKKTQALMDVITNYMSKQSGMVGKAVIEQDCMLGDVACGTLGKIYDHLIARGIIKRVRKGYYEFCGTPETDSEVKATPTIAKTETPPVDDSDALGDKTDGRHVKLDNRGDGHFQNGSSVWTNEKVQDSTPSNDITDAELAKLEEEAELLELQAEAEELERKAKKAELLERIAKAKARIG